MKYYCGDNDCPTCDEPFSPEKVHKEICASFVAMVDASERIVKIAKLADFISEDLAALICRVREENISQLRRELVPWCDYLTAPGLVEQFYKGEK